ncbi:MULTISPECIES: NADP-specific glutamate dehydrogenase [Flavobacterium]|jgi:glutamate dehydrogenase (NADP+)|uniref:Glutamate dehydrogenase n=2 Tax=Flavobacterium johnsoniae TaxID=986 RepID=A0A1M5S3S6_FLAJO|nr:MULTISPECIES: NADP-specific glutamate dehydrogenase [Flavobacterium]ABQ03743.1 Glutamate dehydrogenase (NADP(+)) [Flavobacterium johnsoniae UW101]OXG03265.1 glutamate dehydrogenase [Flavobacterium johnsoniae UW101]WDF59461.1 NADP-specific glutamate dehydrogenase [Flavobacterium sp. KACC 22758]WQG79392.1 NADP-specific glutamate dehydrogenase [Flavobacterium johnsoniae UW101]SHH32938.1 glutamate dehydrogenase (NADP+) [Flavobacterium johnsoniae]
MEQKINEFMALVESKNPNEPEFLQAVREFAETVIPFIAERKKYDGKNLLLRIAEPERSIIFRVPWVDDKGEIIVNRGFRIQMNSAIGPYKGGIRFHHTVNLSVLKFLAFEQVFKNSLTTLPMGGGKGGSDFDPEGKSDGEIMRFCQSFMTELCRHIGPDLDVPAGDIGVGAREIGYLFGQYKRIRNEFTGVLTGKGLAYGGSLIRPEATGYGVVYFTDQMLRTIGHEIKGKRVAISGFGNVAWGVALKVNELGGKVVTLSGPDGYIYDEEGISGEKIDHMLEMRATGDNRAERYLEKYPKAVFHKGKSPWEVKVDIAIPCATQNELTGEDAKKLIDNGVLCVTEAANMPSTLDAIKLFLDNKVLFAPGKAANAGGVAASGLEMTQNSIRLNWTSEEVDLRLKEIMVGIHNQCKKYGAEEDGYVNYVKGANIAGFVKVADAMLAQGVV